MSYDGSFYALIARHVRTDPQAVCLRTETGEVFSRAWLHAQSARYANTLTALGCAPGDRVAVQVEKSPHALALYLACVRSGVCFLPLNTAYVSSELDYLLSDAGPRLFVCRGDPSAELGDGSPGGGIRRFTLDADGGGTFAEAAGSASDHFETVAVQGEDMAALLYTSGTTGRPKGAMLSHRAMSYCASVLGRQWRIADKDVLLHCLPIFHGHGLFISSNVALAAGAQMMFHRRFDLDSTMEALPEASLFMGVPTFYHRLLADERLTAEVCRNIRLFTSGSAPLSAEVHGRFERRTGHRILERYGATETMILCANPIDGDRRPGSVGQPMPDVRLRIADDADRALPVGQIGMIEVRGPGLFSGYWNLPEQTRREFTEDGYFRTGDVGRLSADGYLTLTGRSKDLIISGGYNVYPAEVEAAIDEMPCVRESAIVGAPHADFGEAVFAFVVPVDPSTAISEPDIITWCKRKLANYKVPKHVRIIDDLPRNTMGKVLKNVLREQVSGRM